MFSSVRQNTSDQQKLILRARGQLDQVKGRVPLALLWTKAHSKQQSDLAVDNRKSGSPRHTRPYPAGLAVIFTVYSVGVSVQA